MKSLLMSRFYDKYIWSLKYRPQSIEEIIIPDRISSLLQKICESGKMQNMILYGPAGTSKTTTALVLAKSLEYDPLYINASDETSVDVIRGKIRQFVMTKSITGSNKKLVILDEAEQVSIQFWAALRSFIEEFTKNANFIVITNYVNKVPDPIISRFTSVDYHFDTTESKQVKIKFFNRVLGILDLEETKYNKKVVAYVVESYFPDMRKILNELQRIDSENSLDDLEVIKKLNINASIFFSLIKDKDFSGMQKYIASINDYSTLFSKIYDEATKHIKSDNILDFYILLGEYDFKNSSCADSRINFAAFGCEIMANIEFKD